MWQIEQVLWEFGWWSEGKVQGEAGTDWISLEKDPYTPVKFKNDMALLEYGHIFGYFIRHPGVYLLITLPGKANIGSIADWVILYKSE